MLDADQQCPQKTKAYLSLGPHCSLPCTPAPFLEELGSPLPSISAHSLIHPVDLYEIYSVPGPSTQGSGSAGRNTGTRLGPGPQGLVWRESHRDQVQAGPRRSQSGDREMDSDTHSARC